MQIALLVTPFLVVLGWIMGQPMTLHFETFETVVFFLSVLVVSYVIADGKSNYLEGAMVSFLIPPLFSWSCGFGREIKIIFISAFSNTTQLLGLYFIIALAFLVYPDDVSTVPEGIKLAVRSMLKWD